MKQTLVLPTRFPPSNIPLWPWNEHLNQLALKILPSEDVICLRRALSPADYVRYKIIRKRDNYELILSLPDGLRVFCKHATKIRIRVHSCSKRADVRLYRGGRWKIDSELLDRNDEGIASKGFLSLLEFLLCLVNNAHIHLRIEAVAIQ